MVSHGIEAAIIESDVKKKKKGGPIVPLIFSNRFSSCFVLDAAPDIFVDVIVKEQP